MAPYEIEMRVALRAKAERLAAREGSVDEELSPDMIRSVIQELRLHQAELEMQNEELRRVTEELERSRERFFRLFNNAPVGYVVLDEVGMVRQTNETFLQMLGRKRESVVARPFTDCIEAEDRPVFVGRFGAFFRSPAEKSMELRMRRSREKSFYVRIEASAASDIDDGRGPGEEPRLSLVISDISERRRAELRLEQERLLLRSLFQTIPDLVWLKDPNGIFLACNPPFERLYGAKEEQIVGRTDFDFVDAETAAFFRQKDREAAAAGRSRSNQEWLTFADDGHRALMETIKTPMHDAEGRLVGVLGIARDITALHDALGALHESEQKFRDIYHHSPIGIELYDHEGRLIEVNKACMDTFGLVDAGEPRGSNLFGNPNVPEKVKRLLRKGQTVRYEAAFDFEKVKEMGLYRTSRSGSVILDVLITPLAPATGGVGYLAQVQDVTERKKAQEERLSMERHRQQAQKFSSLAYMGGAVAHHFNNLLAVIIGNLEMVSEGGFLPDSVSRSLSEAINAARRGAEISHHMLTYVGQKCGNRVAVDLGRFCQDKLALLEPSLPRATRWSFAAPPKGPIVHVDPSQLQQLLVNLVTNAIEAMGGKQGQVSLRVDIVKPGSLSRNRVLPLEWKPDQEWYACLTVMDPGSGIDPKRIDQIFDPFYSTKFTGRGMGLAIVLGTVRALNGAVAVASTPGRGSTFWVLLPLMDQEQAAPEQGENTVHEPDEPKGLILLVDDEPAIRDMVAIMLKRLGFATVAAGDGIEAMELFEAHRQNIACILLDANLPGLDGWQVMARVRATSPGLPIILGTGHDVSVMMDSEAPVKPDVALQKPYHMKDLKAAVEKAVNGRPGQ